MELRLRDRATLGTSFMVIIVTEQIMARVTTMALLLRQEHAMPWLMAYLHL